MITWADSALALVAILLLLVSAALSAAETSLNRMDPLRAQHLNREGRRGGRALERLVGSPERFATHLNSVLFLSLSTQIVASTLVAVLAIQWFDGVVVALAIAAEILVGFVVAQAIPKTWALQHTDRAALAAAPVIVAIGRVLPMRLLTSVLIRISNLILPGKGLTEGPFVYEQHLLALAESAAKTHEIEAEDHELMKSVVSFGTTMVREIMVPRPDMVTFAHDTTVSEAVAFAVENGYSRIPVRGDDQDEIIGLMLTKDLMRAVQAGRSAAPVRDLVVAIEYVPETKRASDLMREMQISKHHLTLVFDEYGSTVGLITLEDLLEELIGDISDEHDADERAMVEQLGEREWSVDARMPLDDVTNDLQVQLPHGDWDTLGGLLINAFGEVPEQGEVIQIDHLRFTVEEKSERRVVRVRLLELALVSMAEEDDEPDEVAEPVR